MNIYLKEHDTKKLSNYKLKSLSFTWIFVIKHKRIKHFFFILRWCKKQLLYFLFGTLKAETVLLFAVFRIKCWYSFTTKASNSFHTNNCKFKFRKIFFPVWNKKNKKFTIDLKTSHFLTVTTLFVIFFVFIIKNVWIHSREKSISPV